MKTDLWIVFAQDSMGRVCLAGSYEAEFKPLPGLQNVLASIDPEVVNSRTFFAVRVTDKRTVSLHKIDMAPTISQPVQPLITDTRCQSCRDGLATCHTCPASQQGRRA